MSVFILRELGRVDYVPTFAAMQEFTATRGPDTPDELWLCEHPPVFTQGLSGKPEHLLRSTNIPVIKIDRGGQITYHGPGQIVAYLLLDLTLPVLHNAANAIYLPWWLSGLLIDGIYLATAWVISVMLPPMAIFWA